MAVKPAGADGDELGALAVEHLTEVGVGVLDAEPAGGHGAAHRVLVGEGDEGEFRLLGEGDIEIVTVIPSAGPTDHGGTIRGMKHEERLVDVSGCSADRSRDCSPA